MWAQHQAPKTFRICTATQALIDKEKFGRMVGAGGIFGPFPVEFSGKLSRFIESGFCVVVKQYFGANKLAPYFSNNFSFDPTLTGAEP